MSETIWKFDLGPTPDRLPVILFILMPRGARPVKVGSQRGNISLWAIVDDVAEHVLYRVALVGTGRSVPPEGYAGSLLVHDEWVVHVFIGEARLRGAAALPHLLRGPRLEDKMVSNFDAHDQREHEALAEAVLPEYSEIAVERLRQDKKWGRDRNLSDERWLRICIEELGEASREIENQDHASIRKEVVEAAATLVAWLECKRRAALAQVGDAPAVGPRASVAHYRPSLRSDGLYEIYLYGDDPAYGLAEKFLEKHNFTAVSSGKVFVGRVEDFAMFEAALARLREVET